MARSVVRCLRLWSKVTLVTFIVFIIILNINVNDTISSFRRLAFMNNPNITRPSSIFNVISLGRAISINNSHRSISTQDHLVPDKYNSLQNKSDGNVLNPHQSAKLQPINNKRSERIIDEDFRRKHFMTANGNGRLGNQIFQIATLLGVSAMHGYTPVLSPKHKFRTIFDINIANNINLENMKGVGEVKAGVYDSRIEHLSHDKNWTLHGYYQSWRYFDHISSEVRKSLKFKNNIIYDANKCFESINVKNRIKVGIHIRRGDMNTMRELSRGYNVANIQYVRKAIEFFKNKFKNPIFIAVSDDMSWVRQNLKSDDVIYCRTYSAPADLAVLAMCNHNIITSGTFGWWGAYLAGGLTVYFDKYPKPGSWLDTQYNKTDYYIRDWIGMS